MDKRARDAFISETNTRLAAIEARVEGLSKITHSVGAYQMRMACLERMSIFFSINWTTLKKDGDAKTKNLIVHGIKETVDENNET